MVFGIIACSFYLIGIFFNFKILEFTGFMLPACTFLPFPADTYILYSSKFFTPINIGILGGFINAVAVIWEKYFIRILIINKKFEKFVVFFNELKFTKLANKNLFLVLLVSAFSFIPFEPFRLIAITHNYDNKKYFTASFLGRGFRYFLLAYFGKKLIHYDWLMYALLISLVVFFYGIYVSYQKRNERKKMSYKLEK